jgi:hypothetical protein
MNYLVECHECNATMVPKGLSQFCAWQRCPKVLCERCSTVYKGLRYCDAHLIAALRKDGLTPEEWRRDLSEYRPEGISDPEWQRRVENLWLAMAVQS